ncbi:uncharacterized protein B0I36DRAFT_318399 [Microdochium trichocladiopsis]|uniref:Uncharacterized protein n=1 Tax=Microdochium trichocladiopsis TaxID=1682393 RepID=A0A9P8YCC6_9PEZI|nr:uncharacterized protein B0I36DRAFT_318399 [Microdochium trichocladiopsis]KAH7035454.1 hypothetical protein B0I36DRAFT_318399 [Microdochium trichocladiopsis]
MLPLTSYQRLDSNATILQHPLKSSDWMIRVIRNTSLDPMADTHATRLLEWESREQLCRDSGPTTRQATRAGPRFLFLLTCRSIVYKSRHSAEFVPSSRSPLQPKEDNAGDETSSLREVDVGEGWQPLRLRLDLAQQNFQGFVKSRCGKARRLTLMLLLLLWLGFPSPPRLAGG